MCVFSGSAVLLPNRVYYGCLGESLKLTCRVTQDPQDQAFLRLRWRIQFSDQMRLHSVEETYDQLHKEGHALIIEMRHEDANINAHFDFNLTAANPNMLESTLMMNAYSFLDEASILCGETLDMDHYVTTMVSIVNGKSSHFHAYIEQ